MRPASMEPQLEGCGKSMAAPSSSSIMSLQWSRNLRVAERAAVVMRPRTVLDASMEPQLEGCGKPKRARMDDAASSLQWSRNLRVAERRVRYQRTLTNSVLQWSRNLRVAESINIGGRAELGLIASMEPQLEGCGKSVIVRTPPTAVLLQWSRNLRVAESTSSRRPSATWPSFNGAAT